MGDHNSWVFWREMAPRVWHPHKGRKWPNWILHNQAEVQEPFEQICRRGTNTDFWAKLFQQNGGKYSSNLLRRPQKQIGHLICNNIHRIKPHSRSFLSTICMNKKKQSSTILKILPSWKNYCFMLPDNGWKKIWFLM